MAERRTGLVGFKIKPREKVLVEEAAEKADMTLSEFAYDAVMKATKRELAKKK